MNDNKTSPSHYTSGDVHLIDITEQLSFCAGNAVKYIFRAGKKPGESTLDDLLKAKWYLDRMIENEARS